MSITQLQWNVWRWQTRSRKGHTLSRPHKRRQDKYRKEIKVYVSTELQPYRVERLFQQYKEKTRRDAHRKMDVSRERGWGRNRRKFVSLPLSSLKLLTAQVFVPTQRPNHLPHRKETLYCSNPSSLWPHFSSSPDPPSIHPILFPHILFPDH